MDAPRSLDNVRESFAGRKENRKGVDAKSRDSLAAGSYVSSCEGWCEAEHWARW